MVAKPAWALNQGAACPAQIYTKKSAMPKYKVENQGRTTNSRGKGAGCTCYEGDARREDDVAHSYQRRYDSAEYEYDGTNECRCSTCVVVLLVHSQCHRTRNAETLACQHYLRSMLHSLAYTPSTRTPRVGKMQVVRQFLYDICITISRLFCKFATNQWE